MPGKFPGVEVEPIIGNFDLVAINDLLFENTVAVPQSITPCREVQCGHAIEETCRQSAQAAVSQGGVVLLSDDVFDPKS